MAGLRIEIEYEDERGRRLSLTVSPAEIEGDEDEDEEEVVLDPYLQEHLILGPEPVDTPKKTAVLSSGNSTTA